MNALQQYLDLYASQRGAIDAHSAGVMNALRPAALAELERVGRLPERGEEGFEKTSVNRMFSPDLGVNVNRVNIPVDVAASFRCDVPNISTLLGVVVNDQFVPSATLLRNLPKGVTVCSLKQAAEQRPELVGKYYGQAARLSDAGVALNTLLAQDGVFIHVPAGMVLEKPIQLVDIFNSPSPLLAARRVLVVAEADSRCAILKCDHTQGRDTDYLSSEVVEIFTERGAGVDWYDLEESTPLTSRYTQFYAQQQEASELTLCAVTLFNGSTRNEFHIDILGDHTQTRLNGMVIASGSQHIDNWSYMRHAANAGHSNQMFKYTLDDDSTGAFEGTIEVCHGARFVEAYQSNRNILASPKARMHTKPQLLIYNDDVKCSHGATTGQLDDNALFYMRQRGIPDKEARVMLMQAFMVEVIDAISLPSLRDRLRHLVECRFSGGHAGCHTCTRE